MTQKPKKKLDSDFETKSKSIGGNYQETFHASIKTERIKMIDAIIDFDYEPAN